MRIQHRVNKFGPPKISLLFSFGILFLALMITVNGLQKHQSDRNYAASLSGPPPQSGKQFSVSAVGAVLPSGADCANRIRHTTWEPRPQNNTKNHYVAVKGSDYSLVHYSGSDRGIWIGNHPQQANTFLDRVDGNFTGTTDEILQWAACKWGFDEDVARAQAVIESNWDMAANGDNGESFGILQVRITTFPDAQTAPAKSTAFNADFTFANWRMCYEGYIDYLAQGTNYAAGDAWGCVGKWYTGNWYGSGGGGSASGAQAYIDAVKQQLAARTWESWSGVQVTSTQPTATPGTPSPTTRPITIPSGVPTPTNRPTVIPTGIPTPTTRPTLVPTKVPTGIPSPTTRPTVVPTQIPVATPTNLPSGTTGVSLNLLLHGLGKGGDNVSAANGGTTNPIHLVRSVTVYVKNASNQLVATVNGTITLQSGGNFTGSVSLGQVNPGFYTVKIQVPQFVSKSYSGIVTIASGQITSIPQLSLTAGDVNGDTKLSVLDYNLVLDCFSDLAPAKNCADATKKQHADITDEGAVNQFDYNLLLRELSVQAGASTVLGAQSPTPSLSVSPTITPNPTIATGQWWKPTADRPIQMHWQLSTDFNPATDFVPGATVYDFDGEHATASDVAAVHARGFIAVCYIDVGVYEEYRSDASKFPKSIIGKADAGWQGSWWLDIRQQNIIQPIIEARIRDWCKAKGFDAVEPDEQNGFANDTGFPLTANDQLIYNRWIATTVHNYGMSVGLKSDQAQAKELVSLYDWNLTEECYQYGECDQLAPFKAANKATWIVEYAGMPNCSHATANHFNAQKRDLDLVGPRDTGYVKTQCKSSGATTW